ncbi:MAG: SDR family oxidoreductase [Pseudomonadota bacterium]
MPIVMVTGANRGLGLEFCRQYAEAGWGVLACCRRPEAAAGLQSLTGRYPSVDSHAVDVRDFARIDELALALAGTAIDVLINNAGVYGDAGSTGFGALDYETWTAIFRVNTQAPVKIAEAFLPHVSRSQRKLIVTVSSLMGSIADNGSGGSFLYRSSKAAVNAAMHSLSIDLRPKNVGVLILHPGWVLTDMGGKNALITAAESVAGMRHVIDKFNLGESGSFINYTGKHLPW